MGPAVFIAGGGCLFPLHHEGLQTWIQYPGVCTSCVAYSVCRGHSTVLHRITTMMSQLIVHGAHCRLKLRGMSVSFMTLADPASGAWLQPFQSTQPYRDCVFYYLLTRIVPSCSIFWASNLQGGRMSSQCANIEN